MTLTDDVKTFIVQANARFDPPSRVAEAVKAKFGVVVTRAQVERYDPDKANGRHLTEGLRATFKSTREKVDDIPIAHKGWRLRELQRILERAEHMGDGPLALQALEQAAKERGDAYTNRREVTGKDGGPVQIPQQIILDRLSIEELERLEAVAVAAEAKGKKVITVGFRPAEAT